MVVVNGAMRRLNNAEIEKNPQYADFSLDQSRLGVEDFYDRMDDVTSLSTRSDAAMKEAITSLEEQVKVRVTSVENGREVPEQQAWRSGHAGRPGDLRDERRVGRLLDAFARHALVDRHRRGARLSGSGRRAARGATRCPGTRASRR